MIKFLIEKEFKQLFRNSFLPKLIFIFPCMIMILMPWAANLEIKNINLNIVDNDHSVWGVDVEKNIYMLTCSIFSITLT